MGAGLAWAWLSAVVGCTYLGAMTGECFGHTTAGAIVGGVFGVALSVWSTWLAGRGR